MSYKNGSIYSGYYFLKAIFKRYLEAKAESAFVRSDFNLELQNTVGIFPMLQDEKELLGGTKITKKGFFLLLK